MAAQRDKFTKFLAESGVNPVCERCGVNNWAIPEDGQGLEVSVPLQQSSGFAIPPPSIPAMVMICNKCGNIRLHAAALVDRGPLK